MKWWFRQKLHIQIFICIAIGIIVGIVFGEKASIIFPLGDIFMRLLKMLIVPLTFCTLISGMTKMEDIKNLKSVGGRIILYYTATTMIAASIGMIVALIMNPGKEAAGILAQGE
jgi:Na+/H+-dicarboxylate symporters